MSDQKVATEVAEREFDRLCSARELDVDPAGMDEKAKKSFAATRQRIVRAIEKGILTVAEDGKCTYSSGKCAPLTFHFPTGATLIAGERFEEKDKARRLMSMMTELTQSKEGIFASMPLGPLNFCMELTGLFLACR